MHVKKRVPYRRQALDHTALFRLKDAEHPALAVIAAKIVLSSG
jgi:hypothetical protein